MLPSPADGDIGAILGVGYPAYTGGPFCFIDGVGLPAFVAEADRLADLFGEHLRPPGPAARDGLAGADLLRPHGSLGCSLNLSQKP